MGLIMVTSKVTLKVTLHYFSNSLEIKKQFFYYYQIK